MYDNSNGNTSHTIPILILVQYCTQLKLYIMNNVHVVCTSCKPTKSGNGFNLTIKAFTNREIKDGWGKTIDSFVLTYYLWRREAVSTVEYSKEIEKGLLAEHREMIKSGTTNDKFVEVDLDDYHMERKKWIVPEGQENAGEKRELKHIVRKEIYLASIAKEQE